MSKIDNLQQTIQQAQQTIAQLQKQVEDANQQIEKLSKSKQKKWEPQGGVYHANVVKPSYPCDGRGLSKEAVYTGLIYPTEALAVKAAKAMRIYNRLLAYVHEFAPNYEPDWRNTLKNKYYVYYNHDEREWGCNYKVYNQIAGTVYMPEEVAKELVRKLNSGEVDLEG